MKRWIVAGAILAGAVGMGAPVVAGPHVAVNYSCTTYNAQTGESTWIAVPLSLKGRTMVIDGQRYQVNNLQIQHVFQPVDEFGNQVGPSTLVDNTYKWWTGRTSDSPETVLHCLRYGDIIATVDGGVIKEATLFDLFPVGEQR